MESRGWDRSGSGRKTNSPAKELPRTYSGDRLRIARNLHSLTLVELGDRVAADPSILSKIENNKIAPTESLEGALSEVLGFSREFFRDPVHELFTLSECHFRHVQRTSKRLKEMLMAQGTLLSDLMTYLSREVDWPAYSVPSIPAASQEAIELAAEACRRHWDLGLTAPVSNMIRVVENAGVVTLRLPASANEVDAFSRSGRTSIIVLNADKQSASRSRFDVAHELGHLVMHKGRETGDPITEAEANRFASAFLLPREGFARAYRQIPPGLHWAHLFELKRTWKVSVAAIVRRAYDLELLGPVDYRRAYKYIHAKGWHLGEPHETPIEEPELLRLALKVFVEEGGSLRALAEALHWAPKVMETVSGAKLPPPPSPTNITSIASRRAAMKKA